MKKSSVSLKKCLLIFLMIICCIVIIVCGIYLLMYSMDTKNIRQMTEETSGQYTTYNYISDADAEISDSDESVESPNSDYFDPQLKTVDFSSLQAVSENVCAWLTIPALENIDMPVVWCGDDSYYLKHSWDDQSNRHGAVFVEEANLPDFSECYTIIYGHNMRDLTMFGSLKNYAEESFYQDNGGRVELYLPGESRVYEIFSVQYVSPTDESVYMVGFAKDEFYEEYIQNIIENSIYDTGVVVNKDDDVIMLSTCANGGKTRFVVHAKLVASYTVK